MFWRSFLPKWVETHEGYVILEIVYWMVAGAVTEDNADSSGLFHSPEISVAIQSSWLISGETGIPNKISNSPTHVFVMLYFVIIE